MQVMEFQIPHVGRPHFRLSSLPRGLSIASHHPTEFEIGTARSMLKLPSPGVKIKLRYEYVLNILTSTKRSAASLRFSNAANAFADTLPPVLRS